jgi:putative ABC transport system permease protein
MRALRFWLRWSWRDLRERWLLVSAIALTIGIGTGAYAGLISTSTWRHAANDASYVNLRMFDVRVRIADGNTVPTGRLASIVGRVPDDTWVQESQERLVLAVQVDASTSSETVLVPGQIIGVDVRHGGELIAGMSARVGRALEPGDANKDVAAIDFHFGREKNLPATGTLTVSGGHELTYVGQILTPEYFLVTTASGGLLAESSFAALMAPIDTVQRLTGRTDQVNDIVVRLKPGVDPNAARDAIQTIVSRELPGRAVSVQTAAEDDAHRVLYDEIDTDQKFYSVFALVILLGATLAAFNLTSRIVESQRRQIGVAMALGVPRRWIAFRPILVGAQVALLGVVLGIGVGFLIDLGMDLLIQRYYPLPVWSAPFQPGVFGQAALLGFVLPFAACLYPVWRAVSVPPIQAIRTGFMSARSSGWAPFAGRLRLPGGVFAQMPLRNILRTPRRTLLTSLGVGAAVTVFVGTTGLTDTFLKTIDIGQGEVLKTAPTRMLVGLDSFTPTTLALARTRATGAITASEAQLVLPATAKVHGQEQQLVIELIDLHSGMWSPTIVAGALPPADGLDGRPAIVLSQPGAGLLGVGPGDLVVVSHQRRRGTAIDDVDTEMVVAAITPDPLKSAAYMSIQDAGTFGLRGLTNRLSVLPEPGSTVSAVQKSLFKSPGVVSVEAVDTTAKIFRHLVDQYLSLLSIVQYTALALALLIAFNSATIALDERAREHATMFAFGTRLRYVAGMAVAESAVIGIVGTLIGLAFGRLLVELIVLLVVRDVVPDIGFVITVSPGTVLLAAALGVLAVGSAPLLGLRRLQNLNIPNALRVVE